MPPTCAVCGREASVSDACPHCATVCCREHRPPERHECPGTTAGASDGWRINLDGSRNDLDGSRNDLDGSHRRVPDAEERVRERVHATRIPDLLRPGAGLAVLTVLFVAAALGAVAYAGSMDGEVVRGIDGGIGDLDARAVEERIAERTTEERLAAGVDATAPDSDLAAVARAHSRDMRDRGFVGHTNPDGDGPGERLQAAGVDCHPGENVYQAPLGALATSERALADAVVRAWLDSPGHRETLLRERFERQGVGVAVDGEALYVTQVFC